MSLCAGGELGSVWRMMSGVRTEAMTAHDHNRLEKQLVPHDRKSGHDHILLASIPVKTEPAPLIGARLLSRQAAAKLLVGRNLPRDMLSTV